MEGIWGQVSMIMYNYSMTYLHENLLIHNALSDGSR